MIFKKKIFVCVGVIGILGIGYNAYHWFDGLTQNRIGYVFFKILKNEKVAFQFFKKSAEKGNPKGALNLGHSYYCGHGTQRDLDEARLWLVKSQLPQAQELIKQIRGAAANRNSGKPEGLPSIEELRSFAEKGDLKTQYNLGSSYLNGWGCSPSPEDGFRWWKKSAEGGLSEGQYGLACLYLMGKGTPIDNKAGVDWLKKASEQNNTKAQRDLGAFYLGGGAGVVVDIPEGLRLTKLAVGQGDPIAEFNLGYSYMKGKGVEKDEVEGRRLIQSSANKGYSYAQEQILIINKK